MKKLVIGLLLKLIGQGLMAQEPEILLGKWDIEYIDSEDKAIYEFRQEGTDVIGYCISYTDEDGTAEDLEEKVLTKIKMGSKEGSASYSGNFDGIKFKMKCHFKVINNNHIESKYSYLFHRGEEIWRRQKSASSE